MVAIAAATVKDLGHHKFSYYNFSMVTPMSLAEHFIASTTVLLPKV